MWNRLRQLKCNRLRIRRAVPAIVDRARQAFGIAAGEGVFGLGEGADIDAAYGAGFAQNLLREGKRGDDFVVFDAAGGEYSADM